jgi:serine/threonine protein kinase
MRPAESLGGATLDGGWEVIKQIGSSSTEGRYLSIGYEVTNGEGKKAFLKAFDYTLALEQKDPARALHDLTEAFTVERDILKQCAGSKLRRVAFHITDGTIKLEGFGGYGQVSYLIFDSSNGDIRKEKELWKEFDLSWCLRSLHQTAVGLQELHTLGIAHQNLKPSKILVFPEIGCKVSDLERASHRYIEPSEKENFTPAAGYLPPEQWYGWHTGKDFTERFMADLYQLGSLIFFFFLGCSATQAIEMKLSKNHRKSFEKTEFLQDLPYIRQAFGEVLSDLSKSLDEYAPSQAEEILRIASLLCEPDPNQRGDKRVLSYAHVPQYDLQPFISRFEVIAHKAELKLK